MRPIYYRPILLLLLLLTLTNCGSFSETDNQIPPSALTDYKPQINIQKLWTRYTGAGNGGQTLRLVPAYKDGKIYIADYKGQVQALNARTGKTLWQIDTKTSLSGGPSIHNHKLFLGTRRASIIALNAKNGKELWRTHVNSEVLAVPKAHEGIVVIHTVDGSLYGLDTKTGKRKWNFNREEPALTLRGSSTPLIDTSTGTVTVGFANGLLVSLLLATGELQWEVVVTQPRGRSELERITDIDGMPILQDGIMFVSTYQNEVVAISPETGVVIWNRKLATSANLAADWQGLYVSASDGKVWSLDLRSGTAFWKQDALLHRQLTAPAVLGDYVLVGDFAGYVHWLATANGALQIRKKVAKAALTAPPLVIDDIVYWYADNGQLTALSLAKTKPKPKAKQLPK